MLDCIQKYGNMNEELSELLDETNRCLEKEGKVVVITYDSLDFCMDREVRGGLISELQIGRASCRERVCMFV